MSAADNLLANYAKVAYTSYYQSDMIIGKTSGSISISAPTAGNVYLTGNQTYDTGFGGTCYFQGIFSTDGSTWNDFGSYKPKTTGSYPVLQTQTCRGFVSTSGVFTAAGVNWYDYVNMTSAATTIQWKVVFFAKKDQGSITPTGTSYTTQFDTRYETQKIYLWDTFSASTTANTTVNHNLNIVPKVRSFFAPTSSTTGIEGWYTVPAGAMATLDWWTGSGSGKSADVQITSTTAVFTPVQDGSSSPNGIAGTQHYIIYVDA